MTVTAVKSAGIGQISDVHNRRTNLTPRHATTTATMDQKEMEDRLAAAEALSSLGSAFMDSSTVSQVNSLQSTSPIIEKGANARARIRGAKDKSEHVTGRETKTRSRRARGAGKVVQHHVNKTPSIATPTSAAQSAILQIDKRSLHQVATSTTSSARGRGGARFIRGQDQAKLISYTVEDVGGVSVEILPNCGQIRFPVASAAIAQHAESEFIPKSFAGLNFRTNQVIVSSSLPFPTAVLSSSSSQATVSSTSQVPLSPLLLSSVSNLSTITSRQTPVSTVAAPADSLQSQPNLLSLQLDSLPSLSLGSTGLPNLQSIPNLPSLPSAIASLQLSTAASAATSQDASLKSQLSPHSRDSGEKSLPLKKRKIIDSSSPILTPPEPQPSSENSMAVSSSGGSCSPAMVSGTNSKAIPEASPAPVPPLNMLSQVLPPAMFSQLITEINTAITPDGDGDVPLHIAVVHENEAMVKKLIQLMALAAHKVDRYNKQHQTPLHLAVKLASLPAIKMLLEAGADPNLVDSVGLTSTHMAVQGRDIDCLEAILLWSQYPCDLNYRNFEGLAPLHTAVINNDLDIVTRLLDKGADINIMDGKSGRTVLFHAAETNQKAAVELLLNRNADPDIANYAGVVPAMAAQGRSHTTVVRLLAKAQDDGLEEEKVLEKEKVESNTSLDHPKSHSLPLEVMISSDSSESSQSVLHEMGRDTSGKMTAQKQQQLTTLKTAAQGHLTASVSIAPTILQSSSVSGNSVRTPIGKNSVAQASGKITIPKPTEALASLPDRVIKIMPQLPGMITKMVGMPKLPAVLSRNNRGSTSSPISMDTSLSGMEEVPFKVTMRLNVTAPKARLDSNSSETTLVATAGKSSTSVKKNLHPSEATPDGFVREAPNMKGDSISVDPRKAGQAIVENAPAALSAEALNRTLFQKLLVKAMIEKQNGGQPGVGNVPILPEILTIGLTESSPSGSISLASNNTSSPQLTSLTGITRVSPIPVSASSVTSSPFMSGKGLILSSRAVPSVAHSQPTRPLLLFRSSSVDPLGSVELRHVTADALLALQQSSTNSVNPANQSLKSAPANFQQQARDFLSAMPEVLDRPGVVLDTVRMPPVSNHVAKEFFKSQGYSYDGNSDEPKDLSLKSVKKEMAENSPKEDLAAKHFKLEFPSLPTHILEKIPETFDCDSGTEEKKHKVGGNKLGHSRSSSRKSPKVRSVKPRSPINDRRKKPSNSPRNVLKQTVIMESSGGLTGSDVAEGHVISISEGEMICSKQVSDTNDPASKELQKEDSNSPGETSKLAISQSQILLPFSTSGGSVLHKEKAALAVGHSETVPEIKGPTNPINSAQSCPQDNVTMKALLEKSAIDGQLKVQIETEEMEIG